MRDCNRLTLDNGFPPSLSLCIILASPTLTVVCQEADLVVVEKAPWGIYSSKSSQLPLLPPRSA